MTPWKVKKSLIRSPKFVTTFEPIERELLGSLAADVANSLMERARTAPRDELAEMMDIPTGHKEAPADPSLARLLPDFEREGDQEFDGDNALLRSVHESDIISGKLSALQVISSALGPDGSVDVTLSEDEAHQFVAGLNDIRLYLSARDSGEQSDEYDRTSIMEWLAHVQDSLIALVL